MSSCVTIELNESGVQTASPTEKGQPYGQSLAQCGGFEALDSIVVKRGLVPFTSLLDDSQMLDIEELAEMGLPPAVPNWTPIDTGIQILGALVQHVEALPEAELIGRYPASDVLWDLTQCLEILRRAGDDDTQFRLVMV